MEVNLGITEYISQENLKPVPCLLKEFYSDFVVQEVLEGQRVLRISRWEELVKSAAEPKDEVPIDESVDPPKSINAELLEQLDQLATQIRTDEVVIPVEGLQKEDRKGIHSFIRARYQGKIYSEMGEKGIRASSATGKNAKRKRWDPTLPEECHFTMAKENKDTSYAIGIISRFLNIPTSSFRTHGIKDKRAVTTQKVSCRRLEKERLMSLNRRLRDIAVYDVEYHSNHVQVGAHWGNRFSIILRNLPEDSRETLEKRLLSFEKLGFINYFGTQRFGTGNSSTASIGLSILRRDWEGAVRQILHGDMAPEKLATMGTLGDAIRKWQETGDAKQSLKQLKGAQSYASIEATVFKCLSSGGTWQKCITESIPVNSRSLYVHAYQSLLWNKVVSRRMREGGAKVCESDCGADGKPLVSDASIFDIYVPLPGEAGAFANCQAMKWLEEMLAKDGITAADFVSLKDRFSLGESARAMLVQPYDVQYQFINHSGLRDFLQDGISTKAIAEEQRVGPILSLKVGFNLRSGCYATVALREITGSDMGKENMRAMSVGQRAQRDATDLGAMEEKEDIEQGDDLNLESLPEDLPQEA